MEEQRDSATQIAYDGIRRMIFVTHELRPGQKLVEASIAQKLNVSRTPVREAIHSLQQDGLLERIQNRGSFVCIPRKEDMIHRYEIVAALVGMIAFTVAEQVATGTDTHEKLFASLHDAMDAMDAALANDDREQWLILDRGFHRCLAEACHNARLCELYFHNHEMLFHDIFPLPVELIDNKVGNAEHRTIVDAIEAGDTLRAQQIALTHMMRTRTRMMETD